MRLLPAAWLAALFCCTATAGPTSGQPDPAFGLAGAGIAPFDLGRIHDDVGSLLTSDASGRFYVVGTVTMADPHACLGIARFLPDGAIDASFGTDGRVCHDLLPGGIELVASDAIALPDGALLLAGANELSVHPVVCRFDADGALDTANFGAPQTPGCQELTSIDALHTLPDSFSDSLGSVSIALAADRIHVAVQSLHDTLDVGRVRLARLTLAGAVIPFGQAQSISMVPGDDAGVDYWLSDLVLDTQGRLLVTGAFQTQNTLGLDFYVVRLDAANSTLDPAFNGTGIRIVGFDRGGTHNDVPATLALLPPGHIVVAGAADTTHGRRPAVILLDNAGKPLPTFNGGKPTVYDPCVFFFGTCQLQVTAVAALTDRRMLLTGYAMHDGFNRIFTLRLHVNGTSDAAYGIDFPGQTGFVIAASALPRRARGLVMQGNRPVVGGWQDTQGPGARDFLVTRMQP